MHDKKIIVVGGGVAGVCCVEELDSLLNANSHVWKIVFITGSRGFIKIVTDTEKLGQITESFNVGEVHVNKHFDSGRITIIQEDVIGWNADKKTVSTKRSEIHYDKLCITTGASPKRSVIHENVLRIRDVENVQTLQDRLLDAKRVILVGNGGIATELAFELKNLEVIWVIRHSSIAATYFDEAAAKFFEPNLLSGRQTGEVKAEAKVDRYTVVHDEMSGEANDEIGRGAALGPHWLAKLGQTDTDSQRRHVHVIRGAELANLHENPQTPSKNSLPNNFLQCHDWKVWAELSNGEIIGCDLIVEATGVTPSSDIWKRDCLQLKIADDNGILVDEHMRTNIENVYAAGDVCTAGWDTPHWAQIRLWTQARQMGIYCARAMVVSNILQDICFELFSHVTSFFGYKVILLGDFSATKLQKPYNLHFRITEKNEYVKVISKNSRIHGAVLIGNTDLEETMENLILNQTDINQIEDNLLDPQVDLEDYFD
ncbi:pyridine nucleotide-disulfide oxidoreductase domain-containing protein [Ditylenchus destructor]|uniref:Pyridine nucleotide-disulfide oxidoreductase domain-containing protein 1 n=1 Tax=Ditylenchus destructor TaxID=166010 RepID=A0AAD4R9X4_9BILA|nr:pyridine nucleotide-disulfide oxidoreductase domain-containing protein [Ditylenchus destructor]